MKVLRTWLRTWTDMYDAQSHRDITLDEEKKKSIFRIDH